MNNDHIDTVEQEVSQVEESNEDLLTIEVSTEIRAGLTAMVAATSTHSCGCRLA